MTDVIETEEVNLKEELEKDLEDEASDYDKYMKLADLAAAKYPGCGYDAILRDIAHEEKTHHKHIKAILADMCKKRWSINGSNSMD